MDPGAVVFSPIAQAYTRSTKVGLAMGLEGPIEAELLLELLADAHMTYGDDDPSSPYYAEVVYGYNYDMSRYH